MRVLKWSVFLVISLVIMSGCSTNLTDEKEDELHISETSMETDEESNEASINSPQTLGSLTEIPELKLSEYYVEYKEDCILIT